MNYDLKRAKELLEILGDAGFDAAIAGGWVRDIDNNIQPKDVDICILGDVDEDSLPYLGLTDTGSWYPNYGGMRMRDDVKGVIKYDMDDVDIILMKPHSWEQVTGNFDVSVCQILAKLNSRGELEVYASDSYKAFKNGAPILRFLTVPTCDSHVQRVRDKFGKLSFTRETDHTLNYYGMLTDSGVDYET